MCAIGYWTDRPWFTCASCGCIALRAMLNSGLGLESFVSQNGIYSMRMNSVQLNSNLFHHSFPVPENVLQSFHAVSMRGGGHSLPKAMISI